MPVCVAKIAVAAATYWVDRPYDYLVPAELQDKAQSFPRLRRMLLLLGHSLGRFDLSGQLKGLASVRERCGQELQALRSDRDSRLRSFRVLGLCAGAALVILLI